ncbi:MAG: AraC family transcriptional regulator [Gemmatimonadetes bacterium]|nr:AraC family transcriptional regulator [Gemmatimonadota bacterium]
MGAARFRTTGCTGCVLTEAWFPPGAVLAPHDHDRAILAVVLDGVIESSIANRELDCAPASVWTEPVAERHANAIGRDGAHVLVVQPDHRRADLFAPFVDLLEEVRHTRHAGVASDARRVLFEMDLADDLSSLAIDGLVLAMLATSARAFAPRNRQAPAPQWLLQARDYLHDRFRDRFQLLDVAAAVGVGPAHLAHAFRRHFHCSPGEYVRGLRIRWAADRLAASDASISRIAVSAGFSDQSHLTREFRRRTGTTPAAFRRAATGSWTS